MCYKAILIICLASTACSNSVYGQSGLFDNMTLDAGGVSGQTFLNLWADGNPGNGYTFYVGSGGASLDFDGPDNLCVGQIFRTAQTGSFSVDNNGFGVGTNDPAVPLHVFADNTSPFSNAIVRVENAQSFGAVRTMFALVNNGPPRFELTNSSTGQSWAFQTNNSDGFLINRLGSGGNEMSIRKTGLVTMGPGGIKNFLLDPVGNLTVLGTVNPMSDRDMKKDFRAIDEQKILQQIGDLPITTWQYKRDIDPIRHIGPVSQDFSAAFDVGESDKSISVTDASGVALAGIKALKQQAEEKDRRISELEKRLARLTRRLELLEKKLAK